MLMISVEERFNWLKQNKHKTSIKTSRVAHGYVVSKVWKSKTYILLNRIWKSKLSIYIVFLISVLQLLCLLNSSMVVIFFLNTSRTALYYGNRLSQVLWTAKPREFYPITTTPLLINCALTVWKSLAY